jgi:hypothetical protein
MHFKQQTKVSKPLFVNHERKKYACNKNCSKLFIEFVGLAIEAF